VLEGQPIGEAEVVFLADKLVKEDRWVGLADRFRRRLDVFPANSPAHDSARRRLASARKTAERIEAVIGRSLESLLDGIPLAYTG
jgi:molybdenum cofactor cytidylyltransferase